MGEMFKTFMKSLQFPWFKDAFALKNVFVLSLGMTVLLTALEGIRTLQLTSIDRAVNIEICDLTVFSAFMLSLLFLPKLLIRRYGCKTTILISIYAYCPFILSTYPPNMLMVLTSSVLLGLVSGSLFTAVSTYLTDCRILPAHNKNQRKVMTFHFGLFFAMIQHRHVWPNAISLCLKYFSSGYFPGILFKGGNIENNVANSNFSCTKDCSVSMQQKEQLTALDANYLLTGIYFMTCVTSGLFLSYFLDLRQKNKTEDDDGSMCRNCLVSVKHPKPRDQTLLIIFTAFIGLQEGFMFEHYIKDSPYVLSMGLEYFLFQFGMLAFVMYLFSTLYILIFPRGVSMITAATAFVYLCVKTTWEPYPSEMNFFWHMTLWTITNAIFQIELSAVYGTVFKADHETAFANYFLWVTAGLFLSRPGLTPYAKMATQLSFLVVGMTGYGIVEYRYWKQEIANVEPERDEENVLNEERNMTFDLKISSHKDISIVEA